MLQDYIIQFPLICPKSRYENIPVIRDKLGEPTDVLVIREEEGTIIDELDNEEFDDIRQWVAAMRKKYNVINLGQPPEPPEMIKVAALGHTVEKVGESLQPPPTSKEREKFLKKYKKGKYDPRSEFYQGMD